MKRNRATRISRSACLTGMLLTVSAGAYAAGTARADTPPAVNVGVYAVHSGGKVVYHYRVTNYTQKNVSAISIGRDNQNDGNPNNDVYELLELPSGWNAKFGIPATSSNSPTGWRVSMTGPDADTPDKEKEARPHAVTWEIMNDKSPALLTGQSMSKLSISLDKADARYLTGHALITFSEGGQANLTVPLERLDNTPPVLTVTLSPNTIPASNTKPVAVKAVITTSDEYDRLPEIRLESITASEPIEAGDVLDASLGRDDRYLKFRAVSKNLAGRVYTVTYSATDASGNQTQASATVTVAAAEPAATVTAPATAAPVKAPADTPVNTPAAPRSPPSPH